MDRPEVNWDEIWPNTVVHYIPYIPDEVFFKNVEFGSVVIFDDVYEDCIQSKAIARAFKIYSRRRFSIILISQMVFEGGKFNRTIRNQCSAIVLFNNFADKSINKRLASQMGCLEQYKAAQNHIGSQPYEPVVILSHQIISHQAERVQVNYLNPKRSICFGSY